MKGKIQLTTIMRRNFNNIVLTIFAATSFMLTGCEDRTIVHTYIPTPIDGWERNEPVTFSIDTVKHDADYSAEIYVRTTTAYPYDELWLIVTSHFEHPPLHRQDTLKCNTGKTQEIKSHSGLLIHDHSIPLSPIPLKQGQSGTVTIRHYMNKYEIQGVSDIGLRLKANSL